jgi:NAD(P)-dependent dehydrogenase (short-subunit alcohol dehydrogenase family)
MTRRWTIRLLAVAPFLGALSALTGAHAETVLITGANSGLGLEFTKQYAAKGWTVIATHRRSATPESLEAVIADYANVRAERMDVANIGEVQALAAKLDGMPIDVLVNNAGVYSDRSDCQAENCTGATDTQAFGKMDYALFDTIMTVNVRGALVVSESFVANVRASKQKKIVSISSTNGSLTQPLPGSSTISYRASKAALNRAMQLVALHEQGEGVTVLLLNPGSVATERIMKGRPAPEGMVEMPVSVAGMIQQIDKATIADTGRFIEYDGATAPW